MTSASILLIESGRASAPSFGPAMEKKGYRVAIRHGVEAALEAAKQNRPDVVVLDASSMQTSGARMCRTTRARLDGVPIILLAPEGSQTDQGSGASVTLVQPFTARKLLNRIARLLPGDERYVLSVGPMQFNLVQRKLRCHGRETRLTPKSAKLLEMLMQNPGRLLTRKALIRQVWQTDYTGDTRTLDVHMSWLRGAIEPNPRSPKYLKTIRGVGYRLDIPGKD
jgi:DNA-binding response OmpR family regulator